MDFRRCKRHGFNPWVRKISWRRKWQPTPIFLSGKSPGQRSLAGYSPWGHKSVRHNLATKQQQSFTTRKAAPVHFRMLNIPGLCPPDASSSILPAVMTTQNVSRHCQISIPRRAELLQLRITGLGEPLVS